MNTTEFDKDETLTDFLCDYAEKNLDGAEVSAFEEYLDRNKREKEFAQKVVKGKRALNKLARHINKVPAA